MALEIKQQLRQTQQLVMTPQLQQAIKLLQYNHLEIVEALEQELKENPLLEISSADDPVTPQEADQDSKHDLNQLEEMNKEERPDADMFDIDWENYLESYGADYAPSQKDFSERPPLENMVTYRENLFQNLIRQLQLSGIEGTDRRIAFEIIGNINEDGYLESPLEDLAEELNVPFEDVLRVLMLVQAFDPPGIAARDLQECLLNQAYVLDPPDRLAVRILEDAFEQFQQGKLDLVARKLKVTVEEVKNSAQTIVSLEPKPGRPYSNSEPIYVVPDIFIMKTGNDYTIVLNDDGLPKLKVSSFYQKELHSNGGGRAKDYIQEKMRGALWLIKSIHQRQRTIYRVTQSIVKFQRDFFDKGIDYLRPLILKDIADDVEMHESTISRVTTNKYVHTPRGIYELKYFFNSGIRHGSEVIASEAVKNQILRIVKSENPKRPASDKQIVEELARFQIQTARRTVAKYREILGIPPSSKRKKKY
ncbi:RNA polymerase factor sigma-54 [Desulfomonile tiedjei]|uniref:RNA polymerase, sigma 54 subunit, RpoN/SigL n=1 Tax=Desulfomonile tiedjei (strain ATCC 49306 / DSM 6799 / DCB-1) TaxID=706587 RepID=I4CEX6_DESTA|nr:RNA polymerase factor sigma-54 [Desulfomonile tiedjei]AFM28117.1 RNA polymerase, sigma 54 subunit, RpoN/SigL [Desulfomonile tiedjei DSM 6799]